MNDINTDYVEKADAQSEANDRTRWEQNRIYSYSTLRIPCNMLSTGAYFDQEYYSRKREYKCEKDVSKHKARKAAGISLPNYIISRFSHEKANVDAIINSYKKQLQNQVDEDNRYNQESCERYNEKLKLKIETRIKALSMGDTQEVESYFNYVIASDNYTIDGETAFSTEFQVGFDAETKRLIIDYKFPSSHEVPDIKEWKADKTLVVEPKKMSKKEYLKLYEQIIMDLSIRVISLVFGSDDMKVVSEIVFNGECLYNGVDWPVVILSILADRKAIDISRIRKMDFNSKVAIAKFSEVRYLGDIASDVPSAVLLESPPLTFITPIESNLNIM